MKVSQRSSFQRQDIYLVVAAFAYLACFVSNAQAFVLRPKKMMMMRTSTKAALFSKSALPIRNYAKEAETPKPSMLVQEEEEKEKVKKKKICFPPAMKHVMATTLFLAGSVISTSPIASFADEGNANANADAISLYNNNNDDDAVVTIVQKLNDAAGDPAKSFSAFEDIAAVITEGKGVGGSVSYKGVTLEEGLVVDEDTTIYNPGLSLLTESEKTSIVNAVVQNRKSGLSSNLWPENNEFAYQFLKQSLDPLRMYELSGYLNFFPVLTAVLYLTCLAIQQTQERSLFVGAYIASAILIFLPVVVLVALGPL